MAEKTFSIDEALGFGWSTTWGDFLPLLGFGLLALFVAFVPGATFMMVLWSSSVDLDSEPVQWLVRCVTWFLVAIAAMGLIKIQLAYVSGSKPSLSHFFSPIPLFLNYLVGLFLYQAIVFVGLCLFIVPGIIWAIQFQMVQYAIVDKHMGPIEALKESSRLTRGVRWNLLGFNILTWLIEVAGLICLIVGLIPASIITWLAIAHVYRQLVKQTEEDKQPKIVT